MMTERIALNDGDVVSTEEDKNITFQPTSKTSEIKNEMYRVVKSEKHQTWFKDGVECEVLLGDGSNGWAKGRIRFVCEFIPDEELLSEQQDFAEFGDA